MLKKLFAVAVLMIALAIPTGPVGAGTGTDTELDNTISTLICFVGSVNPVNLNGTWALLYFEDLMNRVATTYSPELEDLYTIIPDARWSSSDAMIYLLMQKSVWVDTTGQLDCASIKGLVDRLKDLDVSIPPGGGGWW